MTTLATTKRCSTCQKHKNFIDFHKNAKGTHGLQGNCRECNTIQAYNKNWRDHGIAFTYQDFVAMGNAKNWTCECCGTSGQYQGVGSVKDFAVDHDDTTKKIRGLLCANCNTGIGKLGDTVQGVSRALVYLLTR